MGAATIVTLIAVAVIVGAVALYLIVITFTLRYVSYTLGTILIGVRAIAHRAQPVGEVVTGILEDVEAVDDALRELVGGYRPRAARARRR